MDYSIPMRPRDPRSRYDDDYYPSDPYSRDPQDGRRRSISHGASPPRRHKSQRHRRAPSVDESPEDPYDSRRSSRRHRDPSPPAAGSRRYHSPEPRHREPRSSRHAPDPYAPDPYARDPYERDSHRRGHHRSPSPDLRGRNRRDDFDDPGMRRARTMPHPDAGHKSRGRGYPSPPHGGPDDYDRDRPRRRRPTSQTRGYDRDPSPRRGRPPPSNAKPARAPGRRSSMPATTKAAKNPWWQNPMLQAGARTAFTAGAQAVMKNRDDPSPWLGAKGAKVATAVLGAALVDGFVGSKHPDGVRHNVMRQGIDVAATYAAQGLDSYGRKSRDRSGGGGKSSRRRH